MVPSVNMAAVFGGIGRALGHRDYRRFWASNSVSTVGRWMHRMAVGWLTWELTESTSWLGTVAFAEVFPMIVFSIIAGAVADRAGYLRVMRASQLATGCVAGLFAGLTLGGVITVELVLVLTVLYGSLESLSTPARMSVVHSLVPIRDLSAAIALGSTSFNAARIIGPAIAGALITRVGIGAVIAIGAVTFFQFYLVLLVVRADETAPGGAPSPGLFDDVRTAVRYVLGEPGIRFLMILLGVTGLTIRPFIELLPGVSAQVFGSGPDGLALLLSSIGVGAMGSGLWLAQRGETRGLTRLVTASLMITALALILFSVSGQLWLAGLFLVALGFYLLAGGIGSQTLIQNAVDSRMRARVMSLFIVISFGLPAFGALAMGWLASFFGLQAVIAGGAALALASWLWARRVEGGLASGLESVPAAGGTTGGRPPGDAPV